MELGGGNVGAMYRLAGYTRVDYPVTSKNKPYPTHFRNNGTSKRNTSQGFELLLSDGKRGAPPAQRFTSETHRPALWPDAVRELQHAILRYGNPFIWKRR